MIFIPTNILVKYREFDRSVKPDVSNTLIGYSTSNISVLAEDLKVNGFKEPGTLLIYGDKALLINGNHRLSAAIAAGIKMFPLNVEHYEQLEESGYKDYVTEKLPRCVKRTIELDVWILASLIDTTFNETLNIINHV